MCKLTKEYVEAKAMFELAKNQLGQIESKLAKKHGLKKGKLTVREFATFEAVSKDLEDIKISNYKTAKQYWDGTTLTELAKEHPIINTAKRNTRSAIVRYTVKATALIK